MIKVVDAVMGTGKSSAAITYMNEHRGSRFIYITPYLDEAKRIKNGCPELHFVEPSDKMKQYDFKKHKHTEALIYAGKNIATTHQSFKAYSPDMLTAIKEQGYTLIIDENVDVLEKVDFHADDLKLAVDAGYVLEENGAYSISPDITYNGRWAKDMFSLLKSRDLVRIDDETGSSLFFWTLPPELMTSFKDVFVLTYLFDGQSLHHFFKIYDLPYEKIGIDRDADGKFRFGEYPGYTPEYVSKLAEMIDLYEGNNLNAIGEDFYALSHSWFQRNQDLVPALKNNVSNYFKHINKAAPATKRMWTTYKDCRQKLKGNGYSNSFIVFNARATNAYKERDTLVYALNVFMDVSEKTFYQSHGIEVNEGIYALSTLVQWIWRAAIRDGDQIHLYLPSRRMRDILKEWIAGLTNNTNTTEEETTNV